jgi:hypothetical protein
MVSPENIIETYKKGHYRAFTYMDVLKIDCTYVGGVSEGWKCRLGEIISMRENFSPYVFRMSRLSKKSLAMMLETRLQMNENKTLLFDKIFGTQRVFEAKDA